MQMTSQRCYSYVDLTLQQHHQHQHQHQQQQTTSGNSLAGSSADLSVNTPLVTAAALAGPANAPRNPLHYCCECRVTSGCCGGDRKSCADGLGGGIRVVGYNALQQTMSVRVDRQQQVVVAPASKVTMQQTDDVKLQRSRCSLLSAPPPPPPTGGRGGSESPVDDDDVTCHGSRDAVVIEKPPSGCNRRESLAPMQIF